MTIKAALADHGISLRSYGIGSHKTLCPRCSAERKKPNDPCLSVTLDEDGAVWRCHNCPWRGRVRDRDDDRPAPDRRRGPFAAIHELTAKTLIWFGKRRISPPTLRRAGVTSARAYFAAHREEQNCIAFPYIRSGQIAAMHYRAYDKAFTQDKGNEKIFYLGNLCDPEHGDALVITEGEVDALSMIEAGVLNAVSVPDGAPQSDKAKIDPQDDDKFAYVWNDKALLDAYARIVIATDDDGPGNVLAEGLARRIGRARCWRVKFCEGCKDPNAVLVRHGPEVLAKLVVDAAPFPLPFRGDPATSDAEVIRIYRSGRRKGLSTGWRSVDDLYTIAPGQFTVISGLPNAGKSEWLDALMVNLAESQNWRFILCSLENTVDEHKIKLSCKRLRMPFDEGYVARMGEGDLVGALEWINAHFEWIDPGETDVTADFIFDAAEQLHIARPANGFVIDPYSEIMRPLGRDVASETEFVGRLLTRLRRFTVAENLHSWIVAHPHQMRPAKQGEALKAPLLQNISGSAQWANKPDCGIVLHRDKAETGSRVIEVHVKKIRHQPWIGRIGSTRLMHVRASGCYEEIPTRQSWQEL